VEDAEYLAGCRGHKNGCGGDHAVLHGHKQDIARLHRQANAKTDDDIAACIGALEKAGQQPSQTITQHVRRVLASESRSSLVGLIRNIELLDASLDSGRGLRLETISRLTLPQWAVSTADPILDELRGWLHRTASAAWHERRPAWISRDHFVNQLHAILDSRKRRIFRERGENLIPVTDEQVGQEKGRPFVKQLYLVTDEEEVIATSIRELVRCHIEKGRLCKEGNLTDSDWEAFEAALRSRWSKIRQRVCECKAASQSAMWGSESSATPQ
jgi:hypothetical protein